MAFGKLGARGGFGSLGVPLGGAVSNAWVLSGSTVDADFANGRYYGGTLANMLSCSRASTGYVTNANGTLTLVAANTPRIGIGTGLLVEEARTNVLLQTASLSTQSITTSATPYTLSFYGTGSVTLSGTSTAGPLIGTGATNRVTLTFTPTAGSLTLTVSGSVTSAQLEAGAFATSYIPTTTVAVTRAADSVTATGALAAILNSTAGSFVAANSATPSMAARTGLILSKDGGTSQNYIGGNFSDTTYRVRASNVQGSPTFGSGTWTNSTIKGAIGWNGSGWSAVANNGTVNSAADLFAGSSSTIGSAGSFSFLNGYIQRLSAFNSRLADATLKAFTA